MKPINLSIIAAPAAAMTLVKTVLFAGAVVAFAPAIVLGQPIEKENHALRDALHFRPLMSIDIAELGKATTLEAVRTTKHEGREDARQDVSIAQLNVASGDKKYIDAPACWPTATVTRFSRL